MPQRSAPDGGYDFGNKRQYRRTVWNQFRKFCLHVEMPIRKAQALLMPSLEGDEIDVALSHGFRQEHLHVVDRNPAIVATLKRRYPKINTYGVDLKCALKRIAETEAFLTCANLDFCSPAFTERTRDELYATVLHHDAFNLFNLLAITFLRGRDDPELFAFNLEHFKRIRQLAKALPDENAWEHGAWGKNLGESDYARASMALHNTAYAVQDAKLFQAFNAYIWRDPLTYTSSCGQSLCYVFIYRHHLGCLCAPCADNRSLQYPSADRVLTESMAQYKTRRGKSLPPQDIQVQRISGGRTLVGLW